MAARHTPGSGIPSLARIQAALAGGELTDPESRALAREIEARSPGTRDQIAAARRFHSAVARQAAEDGAAGIVFCQAGLPVRPHLHEEAAQASDKVRVLYADPDGETVLLRRGRLDRRTSVHQGSMRDPETVLRAAGRAGLRHPLHVQVVSALTYWDDDTAAEVITAWGQALEPGESLAVSLVAGTADGLHGELLDGIATVYVRTAATVRGWLEDAGFGVREPGVVPAVSWPLAAPGAWVRPGWRIAVAVAVRR